MPNKKLKSPLMSLALDQATIAKKSGEVPIGAIIADSSGGVISRAHNQTITSNDPTAHAEIIAIRDACRTLSLSRLYGFAIYVTLEPCPMCASAISLARLARVYYAASDPKGGGIENGPRIFHQSTCNHRPELYPGIGETVALKLLRDFFKNRR